MDYKLWADNILKNIEVISDIDRQRRGWIGGDISTNTLSWYEEICDLFDSNVFEEFIDENKSLLGNAFPKLCELKDRLKAYQGHEDDSDILVDPEWIEISNLAKAVVTNWPIQKSE